MPPKKGGQAVKRKAEDGESSTTKRPGSYFAREKDARKIIVDTIPENERLTFQQLRGNEAWAKAADKLTLSKENVSKHLRVFVSDAVGMANPPQDEFEVVHKR